MKKMKLNELISIKNNEDSIWFKVKGNKETLRKIDSVFKISENIEEFDNIVYGDERYNKLLETNYCDLYFEGDDYLVYLIFGKKEIHIILRKVKSYKKYKTKILAQLRFVPKG